MKIAVIDSGIDKSFLCKGTLFLDMIVGKEGRLCERTVEPLLTEHGTICAQIIEKYTDEPPQFYSLCVFDNEEMKTSCDTLISALRWCYDNKIPLIHMSIGSRCAADFEKIRLETQKLIAAGQIIVAAVSNARTIYGTCTAWRCLASSQTNTCQDFSGQFANLLTCLLHHATGSAAEKKHRYPTAMPPRQ